MSKKHPSPDLTAPVVRRPFYDQQIPFWRQLGSQLTLVFVLLAVLPIAVVFLVTIPRLTSHTQQQVARQLETVVMLKKERVEGWLTEGQFVLGLPLSDAAKKYRFSTFAASTLEEPTASQELDQKIINQMLQSLLNAQSLFEEYFIYNREGEIVAATRPGEIGQSVVKQPYFEGSLAGPLVQIPYLELGGADLTMVMTEPLLDLEAKQTVGVLAGRLKLQVLQNIMAETSGSEDTFDTYLVNRSDHILITPAKLANFALARAQSEGIDRALQGEAGWGVYDNYARPARQVIGAYHWIPELDAAIVAEVEETTAMASFTEAAVFGVSVAVIAALVAVLIGLYSAARVSGPIARLTEAAGRLAGGDLSQQVQLSQRNEIGLLARAFNGMAAQLQELVVSLEERVAARTRRLEEVAVLGEQLSSILNLEALLPEVVNRIQAHFGYYHAQIYLLDDDGENLVIAAGTGEAGAEMKHQGHSIPRQAPTSLVAQAARLGEVVRVDNVRETEDWLPNPLLPDTRAEMVVPIISNEQVVGVLDVQASQLAGLDEGDASLLRSLANQVAVAIRNARLFTDVETALAEARAVQEQYVLQAWDKTRLARRSTGRVQFSLGETATLSEDTIAGARQQALASQEPTLVILNGHTADEPAEARPVLVAPIMLRDVAIGNLQLHGIEADREWGEGELALISAVVDQIAQVAEILRLLSETQEQASREQLIGQVSDKFRRAPDIDSLVQIAVGELSRVLGPARTFARLGPQSALEVVEENWEATRQEPGIERRGESPGKENGNAKGPDDRT